MSQAKVDRYKEEKRNREKIMKKQKREWMLTKTVLAVFGVAIIGWAGVSVYQTATTGTVEDTPVEVQNYTVDTSALDDVLIGTSAE